MPGMLRVGPACAAGVLAAAWLCVVPCRASAQVGAATLTGVVHDAAGAAASGATVTATAALTSQRRIVTASADGVYVVAGLAPGEYAIDVTLQGFRSIHREGLRVSTGETVRVDFMLAIGSVSEQVTVSAAASVLRTDAASLG